ncbi:efflux RND transporter periplasmic adaptor subunit, partial [Staphylococcus epidermidis]|uniref:efflux RND transporter periplasmic adaptor subunit n=1 Tax=Staphylococcus epidermidis TaxID=1282 RepID=UPI003B00CBDB
AKSKADIARAEADAASANAQVQLATAELGRIESLGTSGTKSELDKAKATLAANKAAVEVAAANKKSAEAALRTAELQLGYTDIRAPIAGRISRTLVTPGNLVGGTTNDTLLTTIVSQDPIYIYFDVPELDREQLDPQGAKG